MKLVEVELWVRAWQNFVTSWQCVTCSCWSRIFRVAPKPEVLASSWAFRLAISAVSFSTSILRSAMIFSFSLRSLSFLSKLATKIILKMVNACLLVYLRFYSIFFLPFILAFYIQFKFGNFCFQFTDDFVFVSELILPILELILVTIIEELNLWVVNADWDGPRFSGGFLTLHWNNNKHASVLYLELDQGEAEGLLHRTTQNI